MKKISRALCLVLALVMVFVLAACGSEAPKDVDISALADDLLAAGEFGEPLSPLDSSVALGLYACAEGTEAVAYAGSGATAEELAVFKCSSEDAATALVSSLETRNQTRIEQYSSYNPAEVPKLESALIMSSGVYVVLCVATDVSGVRQAAESALG